MPVITWEDKLAWIVRLEDQRILRDPNPPPPAVLRAATRTEPAIVAPPQPSDLIRLLDDMEPRVRRRAALAIGRVGLREGIEPVTRLLQDAEFEVRQMAAFALGLIGDASARPALTMALSDQSPIVQGRAAEALGAIGDRSDAAAVSTMVQAHIKAGVLTGIQSDSLDYPLTPEIEAVRLGVFALTRLGAYEALTAAVVSESGRPVSTWWPIAYALQRVGDPRAAPALLLLVDTPGRYTASFAIKGLAAAKAKQATPTLHRLVEQRRAPTAVLIQAVRALAALGDEAIVPVLLKIGGDQTADAALRLEAMTAFGTLASSAHVDILLDLITDTAPANRGLAMRALARIDPETFMSTLASLDPDREWTVRVALAQALGTVPAESSAPRLRSMLGDRDQRVIPAVIAALAASKAPGVDRVVLDQLKADDFVVRAAAATAMADLKLTMAAPELLTAYRSAFGDSTYVARGAILTALNRLDPTAARPLLQEALRDRDWALRVRAAALLREQGVTDGLDEAIRPATAGRAVTDPAWRALIAPQFSPHAYIETSKGTIEIELAVNDAPLTSDNFITLARKGFFNGVAIHRVVPDFVVQDGDPRGDGEGGPGYTIRDELNELPYLTGTVGMALDWKDTGGSQFFITHSPQPHLDARYTVFGRVVAGADVLDRIMPWDVVQRVRIWDGVSPQ